MNNLKKIFNLAFPLTIGFLASGMSFAVIALDRGLSTSQVILMSLLVYAPTSQVIAVTLLATGQSMMTVLLTTFVVNLRHVVLSAAIAPHLRSWSKFSRFLFGLELCDETFLVHNSRFSVEKPEPKIVYGVNLVSHGSFILGTAVGCFAKMYVKSAEDFGLDFAIPALCIGLLAQQIKDRRTLYIGLCAGAAVILSSFFGFNTWSILLATALGATIGAWSEIYEQQPDTSHRIDGTCHADSADRAHLSVG